MYLCASFTKRGMNSNRNKIAIKRAIKNVVMTLIPLGTPILVKYT